MKHLFSTVIVIGLIFAAWNDQTSTPPVTEALKARAADEYFAAHPKAKTLPPKDFTTDGCTLFPDSFLNIVSWQDVCIEHDISYWGGGSKAERDAADAKLKDDGNKIISGLGDMMAFAAKIGGSPLLPLPWRWGYGWTIGRGYTN